MAMPRPCARTNEPGQEAVEFALLLPVLVLIVFGVLDLGRAFHAAITITNAARVGARYGMVYPSDEAGIIAATKAEADGSGIELYDDGVSDDIEVGCPEGCGQGLPIRVTVNYTFTLITGMILPDPNIPMTRYEEMMVP